MDAEVTESAGTPAGPEGETGDERTSGTPENSHRACEGSRDGSGSDSGTGSDGTENACAGRRPRSGGTPPAPGGSAPDSPPGTGSSTDSSTGPGAGGETGGRAAGSGDGDRDGDGDGGRREDSGPAAPGPPPGGSDSGSEPVPDHASADGADTPRPGRPAPGSPVEPKVTAVTETAAEEPPGGAHAGRKRHWVRWAALGTALLVMAGSGTAWWLYQKLDSNITADTTAATELRTHEKERPVPIVLKAENILLLGSDSRAGAGNSKYGRDDGGSHRADTAILLHIAADRQSATAVSLPRDLMATVPSCRRPDGTRSREQFTQFNSAFEIGGAACAIRTVERMTGVRVNHHIVVDFSGFKEMVDAVGGVEVCLKEPVDDPAAKLKLAEGKQTLDGEEALGFVRARKSLGDGSDTERIQRQQQFLGSLVKKVQSNGVLLNPAKLYRLLDAATRSLTTDPGLASLADLQNLLRSVRSIPTEDVQFLTVPRKPYTGNPNRDELVQPKASQLFKQLHEDTPITVVPRDDDGTETGSTGLDSTVGVGESERGADSARTPLGTGSAAPTPSPSFTGTNAAVGPCE
jgi:LCP family protein required for cell wall assembly